MFTQPSRLTFWRILLGVIPAVVVLAIAQLWQLAAKLRISPLASKSWLGSLGALAVLGCVALGLFVLTWTPGRERLLDTLEALSKVTGPLRWLGVPALLVSLSGSSFILFHTYYGDLLRDQDWVRFFIFLLLAWLGMNALKMLRPAFSWPEAFLVVVLLQITVYRVALDLTAISAYPFAVGWSETSRFYWPSLFVAQSVYGQPFPWPILHPSLHLLLVPPYLFNAPLWFHRFWQVGIRFLLVGLIPAALLFRLKIEDRVLRRLTAIWIFAYLFTFGLYLHLAVPVLIMLWGFSSTNQRRAWISLIAASIWAGLSRLNWYPVPGILAAVLFFLEVPSRGKSPWRYLLKPALWFVVGTGIAFVVQRLYIAFSGIPNAGDFYTSLNSRLLWDRLWPNPSFPLGILLGAAIFSCALWLVIGFRVWQQRSEWSALRLSLISLALLVLFAGGVIVSLKIGGGADLHNMDAYAVLLMIVAAYLCFGRFTPEPVERPARVGFHWGVMALLVFVPAFFILQGKAAFLTYDPVQSQATLAALQQRVDLVDAQGGQMLFITQRHLISMHMLKGVKLIPEYEREELMEMAMADNEAYLQTFRSDLEKHRFSAIVVDQLQFNILGDGYAMGAENDAWARYVGKRILCNYQAADVFAADHIVVYVPQQGTAHCP